MPISIHTGYSYCQQVGYLQVLGQLLFMMISQKVKHCHYEQHFLSFIFPTLSSHIFQSFLKLSTSLILLKVSLLQHIFFKCSFALKFMVFYWSLLLSSFSSFQFFLLGLTQSFLLSCRPFGFVNIFCCQAHSYFSKLSPLLCVFRKSSLAFKFLFFYQSFLLSSFQFFLSTLTQSFILSCGPFTSTHLLCYQTTGSFQVSIFLQLLTMTPLKFLFFFFKFCKLFCEFNMACSCFVGLKMNQS